MARTKTPAARSAAHAAPAPDPARGAAAAPGSPAAAICAALAASPGATTAAIARAAGTSRPAAREALGAMEQAGAATRARGGKPGIPDTWAHASATPPGAAPAPDPEDKKDGQPGGSPGGTGPDDAAGGTGQDSTAGPGAAAPENGDRGEAGTSAAPDPGTGQPGPHDDAPAAGDREDAVPGEQDDQAVRGGGASQDPDDADVPSEDDAAPADGRGEAGGAPDPAVVTEITGRIAQVRAAADAAAAVLAGDGDLRAALAGLDEACEQAAQARRELKAALGGRKAPAARPGGLRDKVLAHLDAHPGAEFTPHEIHKVLGNSSGAIANALDTLVKLGDAELASEKPRRFRRVAGPAAPGTPGTDAADGAADSTELAGAA
jgi:hypothetical protein